MNSFMDFFHDYVITYLLGSYGDIQIQIFDWITTLDDIITIVFSWFLCYGVMRLLLWKPLQSFTKLLYRSK